MYRENPLNVDHSYPQWKSLESDLTRYYEECSRETSSHRYRGERRKQYCAGVAWKRARMSGKHKGYFTRMARREAAEGMAYEIPTLVTGALNENAQLVQSGNYRGVRYEVWYDSSPHTARRRTSSNASSGMHGHGEHLGPYATVVYTPYESETSGNGVEAEQIESSDDLSTAAMSARRYIDKLASYGPLPVSNPLSNTADIAIAVGGAVALAAVAYFVFKPASSVAVKSGAGATNINAGGTNISVAPGHPVFVPTGSSRATVPPTAISVLPGNQYIATPPVIQPPSSSQGAVITDISSVQAAASMFNTIATNQNNAGSQPQWVLVNASAIQSASDLNFYGAMQFFEQWANMQIANGVSIPGVTGPLRTDGQLDAFVQAALTYFSTTL